MGTRVVTRTNTRMPIHKRSGATIIEVVTGLAATTVLLATAAAVVGAGRGEETASVIARDGTHLRQLHQVMAIYAQDAKSEYPRPGLIDRLAVHRDGAEVHLPGVGEEDVSRNITANLYSALIVQNYFTAELAISPVDRNPHVTVKADYNYEAYDPTEDLYWDATFQADLENLSNASYAHLVLDGERVKLHWRAVAAGADGPAIPVLGNRGPLGGEPDWASYTCSPHGQWAGHLVANDGSMIFADAMTREGLEFERGSDVRLDNVFAIETGRKGSDVVLSFTKAIEKNGALIQHD